jgi:hypothetical protein
VIDGIVMPGQLKKWSKKDVAESADHHNGPPQADGDPDVSDLRRTLLASRQRMLRFG